MDRAEAAVLVGFWLLPARPVKAEADEAALTRAIRAEVESFIVLAGRVTLVARPTVQNTSVRVAFWRYSSAKSHHASSTVQVRSGELSRALAFKYVAKRDQYMLRCNNGIKSGTRGISDPFD